MENQEKYTQIDSKPPENAGNIKELVSIKDDILYDFFLMIQGLERRPVRGGEYVRIRQGKPMVSLEMANEYRFIIHNSVNPLTARTSVAECQIEAMGMDIGVALAHFTGNMYWEEHQIDSNLWSVFENLTEKEIQELGLVSDGKPWTVKSFISISHIRKVRSKYKVPLPAKGLFANQVCLINSQILQMMLTGFQRSEEGLMLNYEKITNKQETVFSTMENTQNKSRGIGGIFSGLTNSNKQQQQNYGGQNGY